ncbi:MAG: DUF4153 domain-containing protein [Alphaproteobacteria bacterium]|nr:DUF4153 domain-containing protein [Alphaproteobacteria bacterium]
MPMQQLTVVRAAIGLAQGLALYLLHAAHLAKAWPATEGMLYAGTLAVAVFVPTVAIAGLGSMRRSTLAIWTIAALGFSAAIGAYDIWREPVTGSADAPRIVPGFMTWVTLAAATFIVHSLVAAGDADRAAIARYPTYFDVSWKHGVQAVLCGLFVGAFWGLLWLGASLFMLIKVEFLSSLIKQLWFSIPVTLMTLACAVHVTDVSAGLVAGARTLKLTLLSWLLPLMTAFAVLFLVALPFAGLEPLWSTRRATGILLASVAALVFLINAAYQDGLPETPIAPILRWSRAIASVALVPLIVLAGYGLMLRVQQYGWTPQRIIALACVAVGACYAAGYAFAVARSQLALKQLERTNIFTASAIVAVLVALVSPIADPARISVADQVARLRAGEVAPERFDFAFLRFNAGRYGTEALERLARDGGEPAVMQRVQQALAAKTPWQLREQVQPKATPETRAANITVVHSGGRTALPDAFLRQEWTGTLQWRVPRCLTAPDKARCDALLVDLDGDAQDEIVVIGTPGAAAAFGNVGGQWILLGTLANINCKGARDALKSGGLELVAPKLKDIEVGGQRLRVNTECNPPSTP